MEYFFVNCSVSLQGVQETVDQINPKPDQMYLVTLDFQPTK